MSQDNKMMHILRNPYSHGQEVRDARLWAGDRIEALEREVAAHAQDAARYRLLRARHCGGDEQWFVYGMHTDTPEGFDAEIDALTPAPTPAADSPAADADGQ